MKALPQGASEKQPVPVHPRATPQLTPAPTPHPSARQAPSLLLPSSVGARVTPGTHSHILTGTQAVTDRQGCLGVQKQVTKSYFLK